MPQQQHWSIEMYLWNHWSSIDQYIYGLYGYTLEETTDLSRKEPLVYKDKLWKEPLFYKDVLHRVLPVYRDLIPCQEPLDYTDIPQQEPMNPIDQLNWFQPEQPHNATRQIIINRYCTVWLFPSVEVFHSEQNYMKDLPIVLHGTSFLMTRLRRRLKYCSPRSQTV